MPYVDLQTGDIEDEFGNEVVPKTMHAYDKVTRLIAVASETGAKQKEIINDRLVEIGPWEGEKFKGYFSVAVDDILISFKCREPYAVKQVLRITGE